jgi:hypothetical protein
VWRAAVATGRLLGPLLVFAGWSAYVWFSGRPWRHHVAHRVVRREVRAAGNWAASLAAAGLVWRPAVTGAVLGAAGLALVATATTLRRRERLTGSGQSPIRVTATTGPTQQLTEGR